MRDAKVNREKKWPPEMLGPRKLLRMGGARVSGASRARLERVSVLGFHAAFLLAVFFRVTHDGLSERSKEFFLYLVWFPDSLY